VAGLITFIVGAAVAALAIGAWAVARWRAEQDHHRRPPDARAARHRATAHAPIARVATAAPTMKVISPATTCSFVQMAGANGAREPLASLDASLGYSRDRVRASSSGRRRAL